ncbi:MAG: immunoglobulin-like domain-containing protein, partial [Acholeplasmataceae bacterium]
MKRLLTIISILALAIGLIACNGNDKPVDDPALVFLQDAYDTLSGLIANKEDIKANFEVPTTFLDGVTGVWSSSEPGVVSIEDPVDGIALVKVNRPDFEDGDATVKLSVVLSVPAENSDEILTKSWEITLTVVKLDKLDEDLSPYSSFKDAYDDVENGTLPLTNFRTQLLKFEGITFYGSGTAGYFLVAADGSLAFVYGTGNMPKEGDLLNGTAKVYNYFGFFQLDDVNFEKVDGTPDYEVTYEPMSISDINDLPLLGSPFPENMTGPSTFKLNDVKLVLHTKLATPNSQYDLLIVPKDFDIETAEVNTDGEYFKDSIMVYYTTKDYAQIKQLVNLEISELNVIYEGYRDDKSVKYVTILSVDHIKLAEELTDETKVSMAKSVLDLETEFREAGTLALITKGEQGAVITWDYKVENDPNNDLIDLETGAVTPPNEGRVSVTLVATITVGSAHDTKEFTINIGEHTLIDIDDALDADIGDIVMVKGLVTENFAYRTYSMQDETGSIAVYTPTNLTPGKIYQIIGKRAAYKGLPQLSDIEIVDSQNSYLPEPLSIDDILDNDNELENHIAEWVSIEGLKITNITTPDGYNNFEITLTKGSVTLTFKYNSGTMDDKPMPGFDDLNVDDVVNYVGALGWNNGPYLGFGPNTHLGEGWLEDEDLLPVIIDFGSDKKTGYDAGQLSFTNGDGVEYEINKDRVQINTSDYEPHDTKGPILVMGPTANVKRAYAIFDFGHLKGLEQIEFAFTGWNDNNFDKTKALTDSLFALQVWNGEDWVSLEYDDGKVNAFELFTKATYKKVLYEVEGPGIYRLVYDTPSATTAGNTDYALTVAFIKLMDDNYVEDEVATPPELGDVEHVDLDFTKLSDSTSYVSTPTNTIVDNEEGGTITLVRLNSNISTAKVDGEPVANGIVLAIRGGNDWESPWLKTADKLNGVTKIEFKVTNWRTDAANNLNYADHIYIQTSTDGETW